MFLPNSDMATLEILTGPQNLLWLHLLLCEKAGIIQHCNYKGRGIMAAGDVLRFPEPIAGSPPCIAGS